MRGGFRPGAGRPRKGFEKSALAECSKNLKFKTVLDYILSVINDPDAPIDAKVRLAAAALPFQHPRIESIAPAGGGKKDRQQVAAEEAGVGRFAPPEPPRLVAVNG